MLVFKIGQKAFNFGEFTLSTNIGTIISRIYLFTIYVIIVRGQF